MRDIMIQDDVKLVEKRLSLFEQATGCELLLVVTNASDPYPAASWRFGFVTGFILCFVFSLFFEFHHSYLWPLTFLLITGFMTWLGHFTWAKRLALSDWEVARESHEKSIEYFHTLGSSQVTHKVTAMIMVSVLERKITVLIDEKLKSKIPQKALDELIAGMKTHFKDGNMGLGFLNSIENLEKKILDSFSGRVSEVNPSELSDTIHFITAR